MNQVLDNPHSLGSDQRAEAVAAVLRVLGNRHRLRILCHLLDAGEASAGELAQHLGLGDSGLSQHLKRLREAGLVASRRQARTILYRIGDLGDPHLPSLLKGICAPVTAARGRAASVRAAVAWAMDSAADDDSGSWETPAIHAAGPVRYLPDAAWLPEPDSAYRLGFVLDAPSATPAEIHPGLARVARTINLYAASDVSADDLDCVVVIAGRASDCALDDVPYRRRHAVANPNGPLLDELAGSGTQVLVCGQTLAASGLDQRDLHRAASVALSALTTQVELARQGYAVLAV